MTPRESRLVFRTSGALQFLALGHILPIAFALIILPAKLAAFIVVPCVVLAFLTFGMATQFEHQMEQGAPVKARKPRLSPIDRYYQELDQHLASGCKVCRKVWLESETGIDRPHCGYVMKTPDPRLR